MKIAIIGFGTVGSGVAEVLRDTAPAIKARCGKDVELGKIVDLRCPAGEWARYWTTDFNDVLADSEIGVVVEAIGGIHPAYDYSMAALKSGRHVITSNKELVATCGTELIKTAKQNNVSYLFEASVGGGIPLLGPIARFLSNEEITEIYGILNGTTNFIMTRMNDDAMSFADALTLAQKNGYAEANPAADIEGIDACRKTAILASLLTKKTVLPQDVATEGITKLTAEDSAAAHAAGFTIKLLCRIKRVGKKISACVSPALVPLASPLAAVNDVFNAVLVTGTHLGDAMFFGRGAGKLPTANAVVSDIVEAVDFGGHIPLFDWNEIHADIANPDDENCVWLLRAAQSNADIVAQIFDAQKRLAAGDNEVMLTVPLEKGKIASLIAAAEEHGAKIFSALPVVSM